MGGHPRMLGHPREALHHPGRKHSPVKSMLKAALQTVLGRLSHVDEAIDGDGRGHHHSLNRYNNETNVCVGKCFQRYLQVRGAHARAVLGLDM